MLKHTPGFMVFLISLFFCMDLPAQIPPPTLPPVIVEGHRPLGPTIICRGEGCASILSNLIDLQQYFEGTQMGPIEDGPDIAFCAQLAQQRPSGCGTTPPSVPGFDINWQPNGCGPGGWSQWVLEEIIDRNYSSYSGNINEPLTGYSFQSACDAHDFCWGSAQNRGSCDTEFLNAMLGVCGVNSNCETFASLYRAAVGANFGTDIYNNLVSNFQCAAWHQDMQENQCSPPE